MNTTELTTALPQPRKARRKVAPAAIGLLTISAVMAPVIVGTSPASASTTRYGSYYGATLSGSKWLKGHGVPVLRGRQCVELATRLYSKKGWGSLNNIYGLRSGHTYSGGKIKFHPNGSGYQPVPGDVLVELGGSYQHVAVVNKVTKHRIYTMEQNAAANGRHIYTWNGKRAKGAYGPRHVGGFIHSKKNKYTNA